MNIRCYDSIIKKYTEIFVSVEEDETYYKVSRSFIPKKYIRRTPELMYILEYLKCDGTASLIKNKNSIKGELLFITTNKKFEEKLKQIIINKCIKPMTIRQISNKIGIAPFVVRRVLRNLKAKKVSEVKINNRNQYLWSLCSYPRMHLSKRRKRKQ